jgi:hypothetical protein
LSNIHEGGYRGGPRPSGGSPPISALFTQPPPDTAEIAALNDRVSALTVQRDSALRELARAQTHNKMLTIHQDELRDWLAGVIDKWEAAEDEERGMTADEIHQQAKEYLRIADGFRRR